MTMPPKRGWRFFAKLPEDGYRVRVVDVIDVTVYTVLVVSVGEFVDVDRKTIDYRAVTDEPEIVRRYRRDDVEFIEALR